MLIRSQRRWTAVAPTHGPRQFAPMWAMPRQGADLPLTSGVIAPLRRMDVIKVLVPERTKFLSRTPSERARRSIG